ncbi:hypothetical protein GBAR_LOCUS28237 [Geodia barretti]|uniref:Uncharacterized protein n=1 Tax=Geodia barretti TaxID=519541 RepID=A0AA35TNM0_GEOBA|nr:hypothetical protein GBAR_LOCUS28237 [Geodia barretti]
MLEVSRVMGVKKGERPSAVAKFMTETAIHSLQERKPVRIFTGSKQFLSIICSGILSTFYCV